jgi:hypothetical protein
MVRPNLFPGERIEWQGKPYPGIILRPMDIFLIPFSLLWSSVALSGIGSAWNTGADLSSRLFGLPFLVAGLYATFGRFFIDMILRSKMIYFITNKRILIQRRSSGAKLKSVDIGRIPALELDERADGSGTIRFGSSGGWFGSNNLGIWQPTFDSTPQFIRIPNARSVYQLIHKQSGA